MHAAVAADGSLDEAGVQCGEALEVAAGTGAFDAADVFAGPGVQRARQVFGEQRREQDRWQRDVGQDAIGHGEQAGDQAEKRDRDGSQAQRAGAAGGQADASGGAPGQPAQGQALRALADGVRTAIW
ncbi:hypothetical protein ACWGQ5_20395 [Streptomyces sp. NPDC055722]